MLGMLWFDNDSKKSLETKVHEAAQYYREKYGAKANLCYVHPSMSMADVHHLNGIEVRTSRSILPNHLWLGVENGRVSLPDMP